MSVGKEVRIGLLQGNKTWYSEICIEKLPIIRSYLVKCATGMEMDVRHEWRGVDENQEEYG